MRVSLTFASAVLASAAGNLMCALQRSSDPLGATGAWCGAPPQTFTVLGHCPACWAGVAVIGLAMLFVRRRDTATRPVGI